MQAYDEISQRQAERKRFGERLRREMLPGHYLNADSDRAEPIDAVVSEPVPYEPCGCFVRE